MTNEQEKLFENQLKEELEKARLQGMGIGSKAISKVIYDKIAGVGRDSSKNDLLRVIKDIKAFCETGLNIKEDTMNK